MKTGPGTLRKFYDAAALFALLNVLALAGITGFYSLNGTLQGKNVREAVRALRGESCAGGVSTAGEAKPGGNADEKKSASKRFDDAEMDLMQREAERLKTEVDQRVALANTIMLKVKVEQDSLRREKEEFAKREEAERARQQDAGFHKQLEVLSALNPKTALEHILAMNDVDKAARMLGAMEPDRAKKIVEAARRGEDLARMKQIVERMEKVTSGVELRAQADEAP